jgi:hypothetical protein
MKNSKFVTLILIAAIAFSSNTFAQDFKGLDKSPMDVAPFPASYKESDKKVKVTYSRPQLKSRELSKLAPNGKVWRTGANEAAEITFYYPAKVGGKMVKPGTYSFFTIPGSEGWTVILNEATNVWGSYTYDQKLDVARFETTPTKSKKSIEAFSIVFEGKGNEATMFMGWGNKVLSLPMLFMPKSKM